VSTIEMLLHNALKLFVKQTNTVTAIRQQIFNGDNDLTWDAILHGAIMDVARNIPCDDSKSNPCELRKSIWNNNKGEDKSIEASFLLSLRAIRKHAKVRRTTAFVDTLQSNQNEALYLCLPRILPSIDLLLCPPQSIMSLREDTLRQYIATFVSFAKGNMEHALQLLKRSVEEEQMQHMTNDDAILESLGQSANPTVQR